ncbi:MAG: hypothetical protein JJV92_05020 [Desulfosarcina sp.]|nr:hypothetical protein [Desulfobacterales bacterium]
MNNTLNPLYRYTHLTPVQAGMVNIPEKIPVVFKIDPKKWARKKKIGAEHKLQRQNQNNLWGQGIKNTYFINLCSTPNGFKFLWSEFLCGNQ